MFSLISTISFEISLFSKDNLAPSMEEFPTKVIFPLKPFGIMPNIFILLDLYDIQRLLQLLPLLCPQY